MLGYHPEAMIVIGVDQSERARRLLSESGIPVVQAMDMTDDPIDLNVGFDHRAAGGGALSLGELEGIGALRTPRSPPIRGPAAAPTAIFAMAEFGLSTKGLVASSRELSTVKRGAELLREVLAQTPSVEAVFAWTTTSRSAHFSSASDVASRCPARSPSSVSMTLSLPRGRCRRSPASRPNGRAWASGRPKRSSKHPWRRAARPAVVSRSRLRHQDPRQHGAAPVPSLGLRRRHRHLRHVQRHAAADPGMAEHMNPPATSSTTISAAMMMPAAPPSPPPPVSIIVSRSAILPVLLCVDARKGTGRTVFRFQQGQG